MIFKWDFCVLNEYLNEKIAGMLCALDLVTPTVEAEYMRY